MLHSKGIEIPGFSAGFSFFVGLTAASSALNSRRAGAGGGGPRARAPKTFCCFPRESEIIVKKRGKGARFQPGSFGDHPASSAIFD